MQHTTNHTAAMATRQLVLANHPSKPALQLPASRTAEQVTTWAREQLSLGNNKPLQWRLAGETAQLLVEDILGGGEEVVEVICAEAAPPPVADPKYHKGREGKRKARPPRAGLRTRRADAQRGPLRQRPPGAGHHQADDPGPEQRQTGAGRRPAARAHRRPEVLRDARGGRRGQQPAWAAWAVAAI